ncbi:hypothetical protein ACTXJM_11225 [Corynebacterium variabile]|uniref:hypothetical protein n=1 Tax=Corynebacterium variabile TaxID=1727 RepID=UPI003BB72801
MPETQGKSINIFDDDTWDELTGKRLLRDLASPLTAAGINQADTTASRILKPAGLHTTEGIARSVLSLVSPALGASATLAPFGAGTGISDAFSGIASASDHAKKIAMSAMSDIAGPNVGKTVADYNAPMTPGVQPILDLTNTVGRWQDDLMKSLAPALRSMPSFTMPASFLEQTPSAFTGLQHFADQQRQVFDGIARALRGFDLSGVQKLKRSLLPPNLRELVDEIDFGDVHAFLREEAIPLYLVPRAQTALRLLRAADRPARRQILNDCFDFLVDDCEVVLKQVSLPDLKTEVEFAFNGVAALRDGHTQAAQALFTLIFDTLISRLFPDSKVKTKITNCDPKGAVPETISRMGSRDVLVWLPVWNAHGQFFPNRGIPVPWEYSRHATVHKVSRKQYRQRNTIQSLMLVTSLIGYADRLELTLP